MVVPSPKNARETWVVKEGVTVLCHDADGRRLNWRAEANCDRNNYESRPTIREAMRVKGIVKGARSELMAKPEVWATSGVEKCCNYFDSGAHLVEEAYYMFEHEGDNHIVAYVKANCLEGVTILDPKTPPDGEEHFKNEMNSLNVVVGARGAADSWHRDDKGWSDEAMAVAVIVAEASRRWTLTFVAEEEDGGSDATHGWGGAKQHGANRDEQWK